MARFQEEYRDEFPPAPDGMGRPDTGTRPDTALSSRPSRPPSQPQFQNMQKEPEYEIYDEHDTVFRRSGREQMLPSLMDPNRLMGPTAAARHRAQSRCIEGVCPHKLAKQRLRQTGISSVHRLPFGVVKLPPAAKKSERQEEAVRKAARKNWHKTHQLLPGDNEQKPQGERNYFAVPETEDELRYTLSRSRGPWKDSLLKSLSGPELRKGDKGHPLTSSVLHGDADVSCAPNRHRHDGTMYNRDGKRHGWNNRFNSGIINYGHLVYGTHREYFGKSQHPSFGRQSSQLWRRQNDYESRPGVWRSADMMRQSRLGPMGSLEPLDPYATMC